MNILSLSIFNLSFSAKAVYVHVLRSHIVSLSFWLNELQGCASYGNFHERTNTVHI